MSAHLCKDLDCVIYLFYSPFVLLISVIFYVLSRVSDGNIKEKLSETKNNKALIIKLFFGIGLITLGFIFYYLDVDGLDIITVLVGLFFILSSIIQLVQNYFKNKISIISFPTCLTCGGCGNDINPLTSYTM